MERGEAHHDGPYSLGGAPTSSSREDATGLLAEMGNKAGGVGAGADGDGARRLMGVGAEFSSREGEAEAARVETPPSPPGDLSRQLSLLDGVCCNVGNMVGSGIFTSPGIVMVQTGSVALGLLAWCLGKEVQVDISLTPC